MKNSKCLQVIIAWLFFAGLPYSQQKAFTYTLLIIGDSLTEGYGVSKEESYPSLLESLFAGAKLNIKVINGGTSGSTTASGTQKLKWYSGANPDGVLIALGSNDGLRGMSLNATKENLNKIVKTIKKKNWDVYIAGVQIPPSYGKDYTEAFKQIVPELAKKHNIPFYPFLLKDVAGEPDKNLADGIHPNTEGHKIIAQNLFEHFKPILSKKLSREQGSK